MQAWNVFFFTQPGSVSSSQYPLSEIKQSGEISITVEFQFTERLRYVHHGRAPVHGNRGHVTEL